MKLRYREMFAAVMLLSCLLQSPLAAQQDIVKLSNGRVTAVLDRNTGRFAARTSDGRSLLFADDQGLTSHISVSIGDVIYTNYKGSEMSASAPVRYLGRGSVEVLSGRLRCTWRVRAGGGIARIVQELEPVSDSLYDEVRVHVIVENTSGEALDVGMTVMEDLDAAGNDYVSVRGNARQFLREQRLSGGEIPDRLVMHTPAFLPDSAGCRIRGDALSMPDAVTVGRWTYHGYLGTAVYGYEASGLVITDVAVLLQWNRRSLRSGATREEVTAVGLMPPPPAEKGASTFARHYVVPIILDAILSLVSDSVATATITFPYGDSRTEAASERGDLYWDTTVTVRPDKPVSVMLSPRGPTRTKAPDSVTYYRKRFVTVDSDSEIGLFRRDHGGAICLDGSTVWPVAWWDSLYFFHGNMQGGEAKLIGGGDSHAVRMECSNEYNILSYSHWWFNQRATAGTVIDFVLPSSGTLNVFNQGYNLIRNRYNHWSPGFQNDRDLKPDGAGDSIVSSRPIWLSTLIMTQVFPGRRKNSGVRFHPSRSLYHPPRSHLGKEYVFVPFHKKGARTQEDLLRIMAYEDETELTLFDGTEPIRLDRAEHVDTLISVPVIIRSDKPVALYQHHLDWEYLGTDTAYAGGCFPLLPPHLWGRRYYVVTDDLYQPNVIHWVSRSDDNGPPVYENLYLILVTKADSRSGIRIDDRAVDPAAFTVFGDYAYAYVDMTPGFSVVSGDAPLLTIVCGGGNAVPGYDTIANRKFNMSWIPPFNDGTDTPQGGPAADDPSRDRKDRRNESTR